MTSENIDVLLVSPQTFFRKGIEMALTTSATIHIVSSTAGINEPFLATLDSLLPDVAIVDIDMPGDAAWGVVSKIRQRAPSIGIIVMTANAGDAQLFQALKGQAAAYLTKDLSDEQLTEMVRRVANGEHPINESLTTRPRVAEQVLQQFQELSSRREAEVLVSPLTPRETEILNHIAQGLLNKQIAEKLGISEQTIKNHVTSILRKLNANARTEAVVVAIKQGLITLS
jgi:two-component system response regulator DegU